MIRSHVIPRHYLQQFQGPEGRIWVYRRGAGTRQGMPIKEGTERGYFAYTTRSGDVDESLEGHLASLEDQAVEPLRLICNQCYVLSPPAKQNLAMYIGLMFSRTTARRTASKGLWNEIRNAYENASRDHEWLLKQIARYEQIAGRSISQAEFSKAVEKVLQKTSTPEEARNMFLVSLLRLAERIAADLAAKPWQIWDAPVTSEFITTDNPVVTVQPDGKGAFSIGSGFANPGVITIFPINSTCCLVIGNHGLHRRHVTAQAVQDVNKTLVMCMERWAYAKSLSEDTRWLVDHAGGTLKYSESAFIPNWKINDPQYLNRLISQLI
jgi:hypothetical protein